MVVNCDTANKLIRQLQADKAVITLNEKTNCMYTYGIDEQNYLVPNYDIYATHDEIAAIDAKIMKLKHAVNVFNTTTVLPTSGLTIDVALVKMAMLSAQKAKYDDMRTKTPKVRGTNYHSKSVEYTVANYVITDADKIYRRAIDELANIQQELNMANLTKTFEVDI